MQRNDEHDITSGQIRRYVTDNSDDEAEGLWEKNDRPAYLRRNVAKKMKNNMSTHEPRRIGQPVKTDSEIIIEKLTPTTSRSARHEYTVSKEMPIETFHLKHDGQIEKKTDCEEMQINILADTQAMTRIEEPELDFWTAEVDSNSNESSVLRPRLYMCDWNMYGPHPLSKRLTSHEGKIEYILSKRYGSTTQASRRQDAESTHRLYCEKEGLPYDASYVTNIESRIYAQAEERAQAVSEIDTFQGKTCIQGKTTAPTVLRRETNRQDTTTEHT